MPPRSYVITAVVLPVLVVASMPVTLGFSISFGTRFLRRLASFSPSREPLKSPMGFVLRPGSVLPLRHLASLGPATSSSKS